MLGWLPLSDRKGLPMPRFVFRDVDRCSGEFYCRTEESYFDEAIQLDRKDGDVILLSTHWGEPRAATIAHEHRHMQQHYLLGLPRIGWCIPTKMDGTIPTWEREIRRFYRSQAWEMDALRYETRICRGRGQEDETLEHTLSVVSAR